MRILLRRVLDWLQPPRPLLHYRVAPRQHPILFRRRLLQAIARDLRKSTLVDSSRMVQYSDTAL